MPQDEGLQTVRFILSLELTASVRLQLGAAPAKNMSKGYFFSSAHP
jgi:hypothetical protein